MGYTKINFIYLQREKGRFIVCSTPVLLLLETNHFHRPPEKSFYYKFNGYKYNSDRYYDNQVHNDLM